MFASHDSILIKSVRVADVQSPFHNQEVDILINDGRIVEIAPNIDVRDTAEQIDANGFFIGPGWCDIGAHCGEPGDEIHETIDSLGRAARAGGYTHVGVFSNDVRPFDNRHIISDVQRRSTLINLIPIGSVSKNLEGKELAELLDLSSVAPPLFTDGFHQKFDGPMLCKALEYANQNHAAVLTIPGAHRALKNGQVNESGVSAQMGIPGIPGFEEVAALSGELSLVSYTNSSIFVHLLSHTDAVEQIRFRKDQGLTLSASVSAMHLLHTEADVADFNENFKILPPLRRENDRNALIQGLKTGTIDMVVSNHQPISSEQKEREFGESPFGAIGLETTFYSLVTAIRDLTSDQVTLWLSTNSRKALHIDQSIIQVGHEADYTIFSLSGQSTYDTARSQSLSSNAPYQEYPFAGRILGSILGKNLYLARN